MPLVSAIGCVSRTGFESVREAHSICLDDVQHWKGHPNAATPPQLRMLQQGLATRVARRDDLLVRVHVLRVMCNDRAAWEMPELWRRICAAAGSSGGGACPISGLDGTGLQARGLSGGRVTKVAPEAAPILGYGHGVPVIGLHACSLGAPSREPVIWRLPGQVRRLANTHAPQRICHRAETPSPRPVYLFKPAYARKKCAYFS